MAFAFDTLGYSKRLREAGVPQPQAEGHAEAAREFIMAELVTRADLDVAISGLRRDLEHRIERQTLSLTVRMGSLIAIGVAVLAAINRL